MAARTPATSRDDRTTSVSLLGSGWGSVVGPSGSAIGADDDEDRHWQLSLGRVDSIRRGSDENRSTARLIPVESPAGPAGAAGSQQQPPAGSVGQQHPARLIWAIRPG